ncbi:chromatin assembly factor 1 subunit A domain-containing protein [Phthorimaea operculella]|nr:chromatin assembly factor 1 subunit A domain-containing protein [Phthorimaea operculella]
MKKTSKSPENVEVTPNKKKLKQARLPFMLLSDVSPKAETPPSRKRKLSVPDAVPATKVGKLSKENSLSEELVVISDEESRGLPSPKKLEKTPNPYVKLVDAARKKKLQKAKGQKKSKKKAVAKQTNETSESQSQNENSECDDVEMMDVEAQVHQDGDQDTEGPENKSVNGDIQTETEDDNTKTKETNNNSKGKKESPQQATKKSEKSKSKQSKESSNNQKNNNETNNVITETICLDDSNNSSDVKMSKATSEDKESDAQDKDVQKKPDTKNSKESPATRKKNTPKKRTQVTPKRSSRGQSKKTESKNDNTEDAVQSETPKPSTDDEQKVVTEIENKHDEEQKEKDEDSDVEMIESKEDKTESTNEKPQESPSKTDNEDSKSKSEGLVTPKRASRSQTKENETNLEKSLLDESISSTPSTPKQADKSLNESMKNLTPKQMAIRLEAAKRREAREKEKEERAKQRQQEKEERAKQRQEKEDQKKREREEKEEAKRKEREEKEEQKKKEREEKEKQRELEKTREEERRKKQEALELEKQEQENKLKKTKEAFVSFFVPKQKVDKDSSPSEKAPVSKNSMLSSFTVKGDMRLAPTVRVELDTERKEALEKVIEEQDKSANYLKYLKDGKVKPGSCGKTWPLEDKDDDVMIIEEDLPPIDGAGEVITCESAPRERLRPKLLAFHENRRPPYWGTWRKTSKDVTPRRPFGQEKILDYEVDSDDDWEDEADGESLDGSAGGSDDEAGNDDYEVDNEVFVPHGYLSDEEATMDEEDDDVLSLSPETQKARLKHLENEFESEMKKPTEKLKPRLYGLLWENSDGKKPEKCVDALWNYFEKFAMIMGDVTPLLQPAPEPEKDPEKKKIKKKKPLEEGTEQSPKSKKKKEPKSENKEKKTKPEVKKVVPNQPGINTFLKKVQT